MLTAHLSMNEQNVLHIKLPDNNDYHCANNNETTVWIKILENLVYQPDLKKH